jgi:hypothetical protein
MTGLALTRQLARVSRAACDLADYSVMSGGTSIGLVWRYRSLIS